MRRVLQLHCLAYESGDVDWVVVGGQDGCVRRVMDPVDDVLPGCGGGPLYIASL